MLDFDEILASIKDPEIKKYLEEAIKSYRIGNYRSAILTVWIASMFDLVNKFEILTEEREPTIVEKWNNYLKPKIERHQNWEHELISTARTVDMISQYEFETLQSLNKTRNRYAHPSFDEVGTLFDPTPEEVRYFIRTLYEIILSQPAQLGAFYVNNLLESIQSSTFFYRKIYSDELLNFKEKVIENVNKINKRQIPRFIKELFKSLKAPENQEHKINIICFLVNIWNAKKELQLSDEISNKWDDYIKTQELDLIVLEGILNIPESINELSKEAQSLIKTKFIDYFIKRKNISESAKKFLSYEDIVPLSKSILEDSPSEISINEVIKNYDYYEALFGERFSELFGNFLLDKTREALSTCNGYIVNPVLSALRKCRIWDLANNLSEPEQETFSHELIDSLNSNNFETMDLLSFEKRYEIPNKWIRLLFETWLDKLNKDYSAQRNLDWYLKQYLGLLKRYIDIFGESDILESAVEKIENYAAKEFREIEQEKLDEELLNFLQRLTQQSSLTLLDDW